MDSREPLPASNATELAPSDVLLTDKVVVVTGAAQGIGAASVLALARFGANLVVVDRLAEGLENTVRRAEALGRQVESVVGDVRDPTVVADLVEVARRRFGRIDVLVNNAGGGFVAPFADVSTKGEAALIAENFTQVTSCIRQSLPLMAAGSSIINITSIEAHRAGPGFAIYSAMKAAVDNLSKTLALEFGSGGIRVNCIAPDMISTPGDAELIEESGAMLDATYDSTPHGSFGSPDDIAGAVVFLAGEMSRFVTGTTLHVDGGTFAASGWRRRSDTGAWML